MKTVILACLFLASTLSTTLPAWAAQSQDQPNAYQARGAAIEYAYSASLAQLQDQALTWAQRIPVVDRILWADFFRMYGHFSYADSFFTDTVADFVQNPPAFRLRTVMLDSFFLTAAANFLLDENARTLVAQIADSYTQPYSLRCYARILLPIMDSLQMQLVQLQTVRSVGLSQLEISADAAAELPAYKPAPEVLGTVSAISFSNKGALAAIDGLDDVVRPGDSINNIKVVKITPATVTFRTDNTTWTQTVGQPPNAYWASK